VQQFPLVAQSFISNRADLSAHPGVGLGAPGVGGCVRGMDIDRGAGDRGLGEQRDGKVTLA
jgi:hypothetical protein